MHFVLLKNCFIYFRYFYVSSIIFLPVTTIYIYIYIYYFEQRDRYKKLEREREREREYVCVFSKIKIIEGGIK